MPNDDVRPSLRELIHLTQEPLVTQLADVKSALEKITISLVTAQQLDQLRYQIASLIEVSKELEERLRSLERYFWLYLWLSWTIILLLVVVSLLNYFI